MSRSRSRSPASSTDRDQSRTDGQSDLLPSETVDDPMTELLFLSLDVKHALELTTAVNNYQSYILGEILSNMGRKIALVRQYLTQTGLEPVTLFEPVINTRRQSGGSSTSTSSNLEGSDAALVDFPRDEHASDESQMDSHE